MPPAGGGDRDHNWNKHLTHFRNNEKNPKDKLLAFFDLGSAKINFKWQLKCQIK